MSGLDGTYRLIRKLKQIERVEIKEIMQGVGAKVRDEARRRAPAPTGELKGSIGYTIRRESSSVVQAVVYAGAEHALYVEMGTGEAGAANHTGISPKVVPMYSPDWAGMPAQPFLYPALHDNEDKIKRYIARRLNKAIKEKRGKA